MLGVITITRLRTAAGSWNSSGVFEEGAETETEIEGSVQPIGRDVALVPEGFRTREVAKVYTGSELFPANQHTGTAGDRVEIESGPFSGTWLVVGCHAWPALIAHYRAIIVREQEQSA